MIVKNPIPDGTSYIEETIIDNDIETYNKYTYYSSSNEIEWKLGNLLPEQEIQLEYTVVVNNIPSILEYYGTQEGFTEEDGKYYLIQKDEQTGEEIKNEIKDLPTIIIKNSAILKADNIDKEIVSNETSNEVVKSYFNIIEESSKEKAVYLEEGEIYTYTVIVENKTDLRMTNLSIRKIIPEEVTYKETKILDGNGTANYNEETRQLDILFEEFESNGIVEVQINVVANKINDGTYKKQIETNSIVSADGIEANTSSAVENTIAKPKITTSIECDVKQRYIYENDILNYTINLSNENDATISNLIITDIMPEGTKFISGTYTKNGNEYQILSDGTNEIRVETSLGQGSITINIKVQVENIDSDVEEIDIENVANMKANNIEEFEIGRVKHTIINKNSENNGGSSNNPSGGQEGEDGVIRYKVKGLAWEDSNKDGQRQDDEKLLGGITVYLLNENGNIIKDYKTGEEKIATTDMYGEYEFNNVEKGNYLIVFMYNSSKYYITEYQKTGVINDRNSDVISKNVQFNGEEREAGVTDVIEVIDRDLYSIDMGLCNSPKFNLKLEAGITNITVTTKNGTTKQEYNMSSFAKNEIRSKEINGARVVIEYTLNITNNSDVPGSATEIVADIPNGLVFNSNMNKDWYEGNDKKIYTIVLADKVLQPGESTQLKLMLVKEMTNSNTGEINIKFEITKNYNNKGIEETTKEDNISNVVALITVATGKAPLYIGTTLTILIVSGVILYSIIIIRKRPKKEKRWK